MSRRTVAVLFALGVVPGTRARRIGPRLLGFSRAAKSQSTPTSRQLTTSNISPPHESHIKLAQCATAHRLSVFLRLLQAPVMPHGPHHFPDRVADILGRFQMHVVAAVDENLFAIGR